MEERSLKKDDAPGRRWRLDSRRIREEINLTVVTSEPDLFQRSEQKSATVITDRLHLTYMMGADPL